MSRTGASDRGMLLYFSMFIIILNLSRLIGMQLLNCENYGHFSVFNMDIHILRPIACIVLRYFFS
jgi:hypothetical protein